MCASLFSAKCTIAAPDKGSGDNKRLIQPVNTCQAIDAVRHRFCVNPAAPTAKFVQLKAARLVAGYCSITGWVQVVTVIMTESAAVIPAVPTGCLFGN